MRYPWKETAPGVVERQLDNTERFLKVVAVPFRSLGRENWALNIILDVTFAAGDERAIVEKMRQAWLKLRCCQPFLAAHLNIEEDKFECTTPTDHALQQWLSDSFYVQQKSATVDNFLLHGAWAEFSSLHYFPASSHILMRTHHWLIDGVGGLHLANRFLELFADDSPVPRFGDEARLLPPCLLDAAGFRDGGESAVEQGTVKFMEFVQNLPSIGLPVESSSPTGPGGTKRQCLAFPQEKLDALLAACRQKGLTLASAMHAAVIVATQEKAPKSESARYFTTLALFDYRKYLPEPYCDVRQYPMGTWMLGPPFSLPPADFATQAEACRSVYKQPVARDVFPMLDSYETYAGMLADAFAAPPPPDAPIPSQPQLSSIGLVNGKVQRSYGSGENLVTVNKVEPVLDIMVATPLVFQWSFGGTSYINMCYNEKWQTDEFIKGFLERVAEVLMGNMGLS
ncbi:hypothetical protein GE09DRAFT_537343 [Coniochaeta sp. 2T2.1]|nr:hypothetical protein GE09DRAFT_537343 [Coniochaeta sp. 2T2.1]